MPPTPTIPDLFDDQRPQALVVTAGGGRHALALELVREVVRPRTITPIPGAANRVQGLINVRGRVVTVLDLGALLGGDAAPRAVVPPSVVLLEHAGHAVGLSVDAVHDVLPFEHGAETVDAGSHSPVGRFDAGGDEVQPLDLPALLTRVMLAPEERQ